MPETLLIPLADVYSLSQEGIPETSLLYSYSYFCRYQGWEGSHFRNRLENLSLHRNRKIQQTDR